MSSIESYISILLPTQHDIYTCTKALQWRHNEHDGVSNHQPHDCLLNRLYRRRSKKSSKLRVTGLCAGNSPVTGEFPAQRASNAENISIWWLHHGIYGSHTKGIEITEKGRSFEEISATDCTGRSHFDQFLCSQWYRQMTTFPFQWRMISLVRLCSVYLGYIFTNW